MTFTASLTQDLTSTDEIMHVDTNVGARTTYPWRLQIDDEILAVTAGVEEGLDWTVLRGADDTDPADHISGTSVIASPLGTVTSEGHIFRDSVDPATNPDYAPPYIQPGDLWIDTTPLLGAGDLPNYVVKLRNATNDGWVLVPMLLTDGAGNVLAKVAIDAVTGVIAATATGGSTDASFTLTPDGAVVLTAGLAVVNLNADGTITLDATGGNSGLVLNPDYSVVINGSATFDGSGNPTFLYLPTADPAVAGALWNDSGTVKVSAG